MRLRRIAPLIIAAALVGCSSGPTVSSPAIPSSTPSAPSPIASSSAGDLCATWNDLKTSVLDIQNINIVSGGTNAIETALQNVLSKLDAFQAAAHSAFGPQVAQLRNALAALQTSVQAMMASAGVITIGSVVSSMNGAISAFKALQTAVSSQCG